MSQEKSTDVLLNKQKQIMASAEIMAAEVNDWQVIQAYMTRRLQNIELSDIQKVKLERYQFIYNQLVSGKYTEQDVQEITQETFDISYVQALQDIRSAKEIFASSVNINKQFEIRASMEINRMLTSMATAAGDSRAAAQFEKNRIKLIDMLPDAEDTAADNFVPHTNVFTFDPSLLGFEQFTPEQAKQLVGDILKTYPGKLDLSLGEYEEAEIVE